MENSFHEQVMRTFKNARSPHKDDHADMIVSIVCMIFFFIVNCDLSMNETERCLAFALSLLFLAWFVWLWSRNYELVIS